MVGVHLFHVEQLAELQKQRSVMRYKRMTRPSNIIAEEGERERERESNEVISQQVNICNYTTISYALSFELAACGVGSFS